MSHLSCCPSSRSSEQIDENLTKGYAFAVVFFSVPIQFIEEASFYRLRTCVWSPVSTSGEQPVFYQVLIEQVTWDSWWLHAGCR